MLDRCRAMELLCVSVRVGVVVAGQLRKTIFTSYDLVARVCHMIASVIIGRARFHVHLHDHINMVARVCHRIAYVII